MTSCNLTQQGIRGHLTAVSNWKLLSGISDTSSLMNHSTNIRSQFPHFSSQFTKQAKYLSVFLHALAIFLPVVSIDTIYNTRYNTSQLLLQLQSEHEPIAYRKTTLCFINTPTETTFHLTNASDNSNLRSTSDRQNGHELSTTHIPE